MGEVPLAGGKDKQGQNESRPFTIEDFGSLDTKASRPAVDAKNFPWIHNWMPIGQGNMRTLWSNGAAIYTCPGATEIIYFLPYNIGSTRYHAVFLDDGSAEQVKLSDNSVTTIGPAGTFWGGGSEALPSAAQYQSKYLTIASKVSEDAYWVWDGASLFEAGTLAPGVIVLNSGDTYTSAPTVTAHGGAGSGATFTATIFDGVVTDIVVNNPGAGYLRDDIVTLVITGGGSDNQAQCTAVVDRTVGGVAIVQLTAGGSGYSAPLVTFSGGGGSGAKGFVSGAANGVITEITVTDPGTGYTTNPTVAVADSGGGTGTGATALAETRRGVITSITINNGGTGYVGVPDVFISAPNDGSFPAVQAEAIATIAAGVVTAITLTNHGIGYKTASVDISGGNDSAEAIIQLMPRGVSGTTIETYQDRVWVGDTTKMSNTGPSSVSDFSTIGGGGSKPVVDSFLRERITCLKQSNGFLYRFGDSSLNVISNVQTAATGITTYQDSNVDPQTGSAWRDSVAAFGRALVFANPSGVYALYGGAAEKVSGQLDGLFAAASFNQPGLSGKTPTAAVATIFGIRVYMILITTTNPYTGNVEDLLCMWDGQRWWIGTQVDMPALLATQEIDSELTSWGADATHIFPLFQDSSELLRKIWQSKLVANPNYYVINQVSRVYFLAKPNESTNQTVDISVDNEQGPGLVHSTTAAADLSFIGADGAPIQFIGAGSADLDFTSRGLVIAAYDETQYGALLGATVATSAADLTMISLTLLMRPYAPIG